MEKIGLLEDINKGNLNPDVRQRERERSERMLGGVRSHGGGGWKGGRENCEKSKLVG